MKNWEDERPVYEEEMTPQQRELAVEAAKERLHKEYERGRKTIIIMMGLYVGMRILGVLINVFFIADSGQRLGYLMLALLTLGFALMVAYNLYHGKIWARVLFSILLGFSILLLIGEIMKLDIGRTDYSKEPDSSRVTLVYSDGKLVESFKLGEAELAKMQEQEDMRVTVHRIVMGIDLVFLAVQGVYFYLLYFYHPVKEFLYGQETSF
ncbi:MAG: hypothetical protein K2N63_10635 [Lachnospiraceae bacterium]|nr:hypothetical protein [Lachnospiraceae bacterium]